MNLHHPRLTLIEAGFWCDASAPFELVPALPRLEEEEPRELLAAGVWAKVRRLHVLQRLWFFDI